MNFKHMESDQKLRGGYYTPKYLADYIASWVLKKGATTILEPSCGDGVFLGALSHASNGRTLTVQGIEIEADEAKKARQRDDIDRLNLKVTQADFLAWAIDHIATKHQFDAVIGNPPFIRYQYLPENFQRHSERLFSMHQLDFTKHTNIWVPFILASLTLLSPGGRLGFVLPAEILHVMHAQSLRSFLASQCSRILIIDPQEIWFENTLQGAVILLAEKAKRQCDKHHGLRIVEVKGTEFIKHGAGSLFDSDGYTNGPTIQGKWTYALLSVKEIELINRMRKHPEVHSFDSIAKVDVGIVTGANKFFLVDSDTVKSNHLEKWAHPMFGRSDHCPGIIYDKRQHNENERNGLPSKFLWFNVDTKNQLDRYARAYVMAGEMDGLHGRYKCRVRSPWFRVPSIYSTPVGMLKRSHDVHRLIYNKAMAFTTDTAYRISSSVSPERLVYCYFNSLTALLAELEGRYYGGGVLELVPSEIERLLIALPAKVHIDLVNLDTNVRNLPLEQVLQQQNSKILHPLGLSQDETEMIHEAWSRLRNRRQRNGYGNGTDNEELS